MSSIISINLDSFIYSIRQAFDARSKKHGIFESHLKYTPFLDNTWQKPDSADISSLKTPLSEILKHHWVAIPHYQRHEPVTLENISWFALSMATLLADIDYLCKESLGYGLPSKQDQTDDTKALWALVTNSVHEVFKDYASLFDIYTEWKFNPHIEKKEPVDWNVRPPCGVLYKTEFKALFDEIRNARFGNRNQSKNQHTQHKDKAGRNNDHSEQNRQKTDDSNHRSTEKPQRQHKPRQHDDAARDDRRSRRPKKLFEDGGAALKAALEDCKKALETMKENSNLHELALPPQNSFIRRHQHTFVTDAGFDSDSRGEGDQRHVCIIKK